MTISLRKHSITNCIELLTFNSDISHMTRSTDLCWRGEKRILVRRDGSFVTDDEEQNYSEVVDMKDVIEIYRATYANDFEQRLSLKDDKLPTAMSVSTLLNTIFGLKSRIIGCGLMSDRQYDRARMDIKHTRTTATTKFKIQKIQCRNRYCFP